LWQAHFYTRHAQFSGDLFDRALKVCVHTTGSLSHANIKENDVYCGLNILQTLMVNKYNQQHLLFVTKCNLQHNTTYNYNVVELKY
jgi:hypothetical protein